MSDRRRHLRLPAEHLRIGGDAARGGRRRPRRRRRRQHLRGDRRSGAPGAPGDPPPPARAPDARIVVTGCAAQTEPRASPPCPRSTASSATRKSSTRAFLARQPAQDRRRRHHGGATRRAPQLIDGIEGRARAFVQVQNGCDHRCTFCIIPYGRGNSRSVAAGRRGRAGAPPRRERLPRSRAHRRRHHQLRRRPAGAPARRAGQRDPARRCRSSRGCGCPRSIRSRPTAICSTRSPTSRG